MSFQAYLDKIERKTGKIPLEFIEMARQRGLDKAEVQSSQIVTWLKNDFGLGHGHAMALVHVIKHGAVINDTHVGSSVCIVTTAPIFDSMD